ncbi:hypothetical protein FPV67DRAFT_1678906 [Lyophyllum atratum]|nr:hypothetical protein FPV67DRAFT_1678906 [Lyophyllum atratum]
MPGSDDDGIGTSGLGVAGIELGTPATPASAFSINTPMPTPRTPSAPYFKGRRVQDFLDTLEAYADNAGVEHSLLPGYVLRYCHERVRQVLEQSAVFSGNDWAATSAHIIKFYGSNDPVIEQSPERLRQWAVKHGDHGSIKSVKDVARYRREFELLSSKLVSGGEMLQKDVNLLFYRGIPDPLRGKIKKKIPVPNQAKKSPPAIDTLVTLLTNYFEHQDLDDELPSLSLMVEIPSDEEDELDDLPIRPKFGKNVTFDIPTQKQVPAAPVVDPTMAELERQIRELKTANAQLRRIQSMPPLNNFPDTKYNDQRCIMCGGRHPDRPAGLRFCPETQKLIHEGYIQIGTGGRVSMLDGTDLPRAYDTEGGVAKVLRDRRAAKGKEREGKDRPPHLSAFAGLQYDGVDYEEDTLFDYGVRSASATQSTAWRAFASPAERTQKEDQRHDPTKRPAKKAPAAPPILPHPDDLNANPHLTRKRAHLEKPPNTMPGPTRTPSNPPPRLPQRDEPMDVAEPPRAPSTSHNMPRPPPVNTEQAFKNNRKRVPPNPPKPSKPPQDVDMRNTAKGPNKNTAGYHFTSSVQEMVDMDSVQAKILEATINISVRDLLGCSPELQRRMANLTRTRRDYTDKTVMVQYGEQGENSGSEDEYDSEEEDEVYASAFMATYEDNVSSNQADTEGMINSRVAMTFDTGRDTEDSVLERYAHAVKIHYEPVPLFAMVTGRFNGKFGGVDVSFMIDTGSELNLVSRDVYTSTGLPIDLDGTRWSLKGINGNPVPLGGCVRDVPILLNGTRFDHHFFCSSDALGCGKASVILGQPWLQWYEAGINYTRRGLMWMKIWKDGRFKGRKPDLVIALCNPGAPRNASSLTPDNPHSTPGRDKIQQKNANHPKAWIEDDSDSDDDMAAGVSKN